MQCNFLQYKSIAYQYFSIDEKVDVHQIPIESSIIPDDRICASYVS
jgi:hypothetical protein